MPTTILPRDFLDVPPAPTYSPLAFVLGGGPSRVLSLLGELLAPLTAPVGAEVQRFSERMQPRRDLQAYKLRLSPVRQEVQRAADELQRGAWMLSPGGIPPVPTQIQRMDFFPGLSIGGLWRR